MVWYISYFVQVLTVQLALTRSGKDVLQDLLHNYTDEYRELSQDEKDCLVEEYEENKLLKSKGIRISTKYKINDVTLTLKAIENEVLFCAIKFMQWLI